MTVMRSTRVKSKIGCLPFKKLCANIIMHSWQAALLVGGPGTGKTTIINQYLSSFPKQDMGSKTITFSSLTTPAIFQTNIEVLLIHTLA